MKRMLNRMLRYADAIVKRGVDKLIDAIGHSTEPQTKNTETPQPQKRMGNGTNCGITLMDEQCDIRYNVLDRTPEVQRRDQADKGFVPVSTDALWRMAFGRWLRCMVVQAKKQVLFCSFKGSFPLCRLPRDT